MREFFDEVALEACTTFYIVLNMSRYILEDRLVLWRFPKLFVYFVFDDLNKYFLFMSRRFTFFRKIPTS